MSSPLCTAATEPAGAAGPVTMTDDPECLVGSVIAGKYAIEEVLAIGGMGIVYAGRHLELGQPVAIKVLRSELLANPVCLQRFLGEARAAAALRSEHVVRVMDVGWMDENVPYMVMERLDGIDLATLVAERGPLPASVAVDYVRQACAALSEAHAAGIVHRDVKPQNLVLADQGPRGRAHIKVVDFGIAKRTFADRGRNLTGPQESLGSPVYMSPEQIVAAKSVDGRADVWALGVVLFELLTGEVPFDGDTLLEIHARAVSEPPPPLVLPGGSTDPDLERILHRCWARRPNGRYATADALAHDLAAWQARTGSGSHDDEVVSHERPHTITLHERTSPRSRRLGTVVGLSVLAGTVLLSGGATSSVGALVSRVSTEVASIETTTRLLQAFGPVGERSRLLLDRWGLMPRLGPDPVVSSPLRHRAYVVEPSGISSAEGHAFVQAERERAMETFVAGDTTLHRQ